MSQIFYYGLITKNRKIGDKVQRISQKHPEKHSIEILRNFCRKNSWEILRNFSRLCQFPQKFCEIDDQVLRNSQEFPEKFSEKFSYPLKISKNGDQFQRISQESLTWTCSQEIHRKLLKASHQNWRTWRNSSLLLPGKRKTGIVSLLAKKGDLDRLLDYGTEEI